MQNYVKVYTMKYVYRMKLIALVMFGFMAFTGCEEDGIRVEDVDGLRGTWVRSGYEDSVRVMVKSDQLAENEYGFILGLGGRFTERKISGRCATPPVQYKNYEGWWEMKNDSIMKIEVGYWGGTMKYDLKIIFFEGDTLKVQYLYDESNEGE